MLHFATEFSLEVLQKEPSDLHRRGFKEKWLIWSSWISWCWYFQALQQTLFFFLKRDIPYQVDLGSIQGISQHGHHFGFAWSWKLPVEAVQQAEKDNLCYRENYNRAWFEFGNLGIVSPLIFWV